MDLGLIDPADFGLKALKNKGIYDKKGTYDVVPDKFDEPAGGSGLYAVKGYGQKNAMRRANQFSTELNQTFSDKQWQEKTELKSSKGEPELDLDEVLSQKPAASGFEHGMMLMMKTMELLTRDQDPEDSRKQAREFVQANMNATLTAVQPPELTPPTPLTYDIIKCPQLANRSLDAKIRKDVYQAIHAGLFSGSRQHDLVTATDFMRTLGAAIEDHKLSPEAAYALMKSCLTGRAYEFCVAQMELGVGFGHFWASFNRLYHDRYDIEKAQTRLYELKRTKPVFITQTMQALVKYNRIAGMSQPKAIRTSSIIQNSRSDIELILRRYYPYSVVGILEREVAARDKWVAERNHLKALGKNEDAMISDYHPLNYLVDCACEALESVEATSPKAVDFTDVLGRLSKKDREPVARPKATVNELKVEPRVDDDSDFLPDPTDEDDPDPELATIERRAPFDRNKPDANFVPLHIVCTNCGTLGHMWRKCYRYANAEPGSIKCVTCQYYHLGPCKHVAPKETGFPPVK
jgi:hypothetical protein